MERLGTINSLLFNFESLGDNCEFGLFQRYSGIEPLGLLRFSSCRLDTLCALLSNELADHGDNNLEVIAYPNTGEYLLRNKYYDDLTSHTDIYFDQEDQAKVELREKKKVGHLKRRFLEDLRSGDKIFVRKNNKLDALKTILELSELLYRYGNNTLLWVVESDEDHPPGTVEVVNKSLLKGYVQRLAPYHDAHDIDLGVWFTVCRRALRHRNDLQGRTEPSAEVPLNRVLAPICTWRTKSPISRLGALIQAIPQWSNLGRVKLLVPSGDERPIRAHATVRREFQAHETLVFSTSILSPKNGLEGEVSLAFPGEHRFFSAPVKLGATDGWQSVWASVKLMNPRSNLEVELHVDDGKGGELWLRPGMLEAGYLPNAVIRGSA